MGLSEQLAFFSRVLDAYCERVRAVFLEYEHIAPGVHYGALHSVRLEHSSCHVYDVALCYAAQVQGHAFFSKADLGSLVEPRLAALHQRKLDDSAHRGLRVVYALGWLARVDEIRGREKKENGGGDYQI